MGPAINAKGKNAQAGDHAKDQHPLIANRIAKRPEERHRNHQVGERQPVRPVGHKWIIAIRPHNALMHSPQPAIKSRFAARRRALSDCKKAVQYTRFPL